MCHSRSNFNTREFNSRERSLELTLLEIAPSVLDHLWAQDSPVFPAISEYTLGPYIVQGM